eukprot:TRINITY_DN68660_c0_g1_i1.p1 TRINITY_DN68660_c0_g1~~TRINITY_DN68660_c0_g1_i1.p1  ORF type:complete len:302 (-),score=24.88 TRINITY_DN68660_c0_g1_i1:209-1114(-)
MGRWTRKAATITSVEDAVEDQASPAVADMCPLLPRLLVPLGAQELLPGFLHLPKILSISSQQCLLDMSCQIGKRSQPEGCSGGWFRYQDGGVELNDGTKARFWDTIDCFPKQFQQLGEALARLGGDFCPETLGRSAGKFQARVGALNFYTGRGRMNWHRDDYNFAKKERPIVMASVGDAADFGYKMHESDREQSVRLDSGDVIIFGGDARDLLHALLRVYPRTAPQELVFPELPGPGRVSMTWRDAGPEDGLTFNSDERLGLTITANTLPRYLPHARSGKGKGGKGRSKGQNGKNAHFRAY